MSSEHLAIYNALAQPPSTSLKQIKGGRLSGMTDINPQWRYKAMTEQFGPVGQGWKFSIDRLWTEKGDGVVVMAFAQVSVFVNYTVEGKCIWSEPIVGIGGSKLVEQEKSGPYNNDEGYKMAVTDALGTAMKMLGVAADIYAGRWDGTKYKDAPAEKSSGFGNPPPSYPPADTPTEELTSQQLTTRVFASIKTALNKRVAKEAQADIDRINAKVSSMETRFSQEDLAKIVTELNRATAVLSQRAQ